MTGRDVTVGFDHRQQGTPEAAWPVARFAELDVVDPPGADDRVLVVAAHPDDETLGAGGLIAGARRRGATVVVVVATDGDRSHPASPTHRPEQLAAIRRAEVRAALDALAPGIELQLLGLPDGGLEQLGTDLLAAIEGFSTGCTLVVAPWTGDRHPDHEACGRAAAVVAARHDRPLWQYPIWLWHWGDPTGDDAPWSQLRRLPLAPADRAAKAAALTRHRSQHEPLSDQPGDEPVLPARMLAHFDRPQETFVLGDSRIVPGAPADASAAGYFDRLYAQDADPWQFETRFYEQRKRDLIFASLPRPRFVRVFEPGCATGLLTERLAARCDELIAWDVAAAAVERTGRRLLQRSGGARVTVERGRIPDEWPPGRFDLIMLAEVGYYSPDLDALVARVLAGLADDGVVVACSWRQPAPDHPHTGDEVHAALRAVLPTIASHVEDDFLLDVWARDPRSVATVEGIVT